jgi:ligand-binding sensor domain-containing protein
MRFKSGELTAWNTTNGLAHNHVRSMLVASDGTVWIGTSSGVSHWDGKQWQSWADLGYPDADGLLVSQFYETTDGTIWAATSQDLAKWEDEEWLTYERSPSCFTTYSLLESSDGGLWVGCASGLYRWDKSGWREYGKIEGISSSSDCQLLLGGNGVLYANTRSGIYSYIPQQDHWYLVLDK